MKILGEELGNVGRWYLALPPLLLVGFLVALFLIAVASRSSLNAADERVHDSEERESALDEFLLLITRAESEQRGYLLTGADSYLHSYAAAAEKVGPALDRLHKAYTLGTETEPVGELRQLRELSGKKLAELQET